MVSVSDHPEASAVRIRWCGTGHGTPLPFNLNTPGCRQRRFSLWGSVRRGPTCPSRAGVDRGNHLRFSGAEWFPLGLMGTPRSSDAMGVSDLWLTRVRAVPAKECRRCARLGGNRTGDPRVAASSRGPRCLSWQAKPCRAARFGLRQGRAALLPLNRSGHG